MNNKFLMYFKSIWHQSSKFKRSNSHGLLGSSEGDRKKKKKDLGTIIYVVDIESSDDITHLIKKIQ